MSQLFKTIKAAHVTAMKARDKATTLTLSTAIGGITTRAKNEGRDVEDKDVIKELTNIMTGLNATKDAAAKIQDAARIEDADREITLLAQYLPAPKTQMTEENLGHVIDLLIKKRATQNNGVKPKMGDIMADLKGAFEGEYDAKAASGLVKAALA